MQSINKSATLEQAQEVCTAAGFELVRYSGKMAREKSSVRCLACGNIFECILGQLKAKHPKKCPFCKEKSRINTSSTPVNTGDIEHPVWKIMRDLIESRKMIDEHKLVVKERHLKREALQKEILLAQTEIQLELQRLGVTDKMIAEYNEKENVTINYATWEQKAHSQPIRRL